MLVRKLPLKKAIRIPPFLLMTIASALIVIHLGLNLKMGKYSHLAMCIVFLLAAGTITWGKRHQLKLESDLFSASLGIGAIALVLLFGVFISRDLFLGFAPFGLALSLAFLASGIDKLKQYQQELIILFTLGIPKILLPYFAVIGAISGK